MVIFFKYPGKVTCKTYWNLIKPTIIYLSIFSTLSCHPIIIINFSILFKTQHDQFWNSHIVFVPNPQHLATWVLIKMCASRFQVNCTSTIEDFLGAYTWISILRKEMLVKIFRKKNLSSIRIKLCNPVYENNWNTTVHEKGTLTHFNPILYFCIYWKHKSTGSISVV